MSTGQIHPPPRGKRDPLLVPLFLFFAQVMCSACPSPEVMGNLCSFMEQIMDSVYPTSWAVSGDLFLPRPAPCGIYNPARWCCTCEGLFFLMSPKTGSCSEAITAQALTPSSLLDTQPSLWAVESSWPPGEKALPSGETGVFHWASGHHLFLDPSHLPSSSSP